MPHNTPPTVPGVPLAGNALDFRRNPVAVLQDGYDRFGPIFSIRLGPMKAAVLIGPEMNRFFYRQTDRLLSQSAVYQQFVPIFGRGFTLAVPRAEYLEQRAILAPAFQPQRMPGYVATMVRRTNEWLAALGDAGAFDLMELEQLAIRTTSSALMGEAFYRDMGADFGPLYHDVVRGIDVMLPPWLPLPRFRRRDRARETLRRRIRALVEARRASADAHDDFLQQMALARYTDGSLIPLPTLESMIMFLVFSASESTPLQAGWTLIHLLQAPAYLDRVRAEIDAVLADGPPEALDPAALGRLRQTEWAIKESVRLRPMTTMLWRKTVQTYTIGDYTVPAGWITIISPAITHRLSTLYTNPETYDPDRFAPDRAEARGVPYALSGFGGGEHACPGVSFAFNFMKVVLAMLLDKYTLELVNPNPQPDYSSAITRPEAPCLVRYRRRPSSAARLRQPSRQNHQFAPRS